MTSNVKSLITVEEELALHNGICIGVRSRASGQWQAQHPLVGRAWVGAIEVAGDQVVVHEQPRLGLALLFEDGLVTREVVGICAVPLAAA